MRNFFVVAVAVVAGLASTASWADHHESDSEFVELFNGENLEGWSNPYDHGKAWIEDGVIHMQGDKKFFLVTDKEYADFIFEGEIMLPEEGKSNSGICFRCHWDDERKVVYGYQAECDPTDRAWTGGLYDEARRAWLYPKSNQRGKKKLVQAPRGEWIKYMIHCQGDHIDIHVNGERTTHFHDNADTSGLIALQHHGENGQVYRFRNLRIKELAPGGDPHAGE